MVEEAKEIGGVMKEVIGNVVRGRRSLGGAMDGGGESGGAEPGDWNGKQ